MNDILPVCILCVGLDCSTYVYLYGMFDRVHTLTDMMCQIYLPC